MKSVLFLLSVFFLMSVPLAFAEVKGEEIEYKADGKTFKGYLVYDDRLEGKRPGVIVVHEWWGHNEYTRKRARMLAELGYVAFALDMYGDGKTADHPDDAGKFASEVMKNQEKARSRFLAALDVLRKKGREPERPLLHLCGLLHTSRT